MNGVFFIFRGIFLAKSMICFLQLDILLLNIPKHICNIQITFNLFCKYTLYLNFISMLLCLDISTMDQILVELSEPLWRSHIPVLILFKFHQYINCIVDKRIWIDNYIRCLYISLCQLCICNISEKKRLSLYLKFSIQLKM